MGQDDPLAVFLFLDVQHSCHHLYSADVTQTQSLLCVGNAAHDAVEKTFATVTVAEFEIDDDHLLFHPGSFSGLLELLLILSSFLPFLDEDAL
jgi:hypothetical protein